MTDDYIREQAELKLINELASEKFSLKSLVKAVELYVLTRK